MSDSSRRPVARHRAPLTCRTVLRDAVGGARELAPRPRGLAAWVRRAGVAVGAGALALSLIGGTHLAAIAAPVAAAPVAAAAASPVAATHPVRAVVAPQPVVYSAPSFEAPAAAARDGYDVTILPPPHDPDEVMWPLPADTPISSPFGPRVAPCPTCAADHHGIDLVPGQGTPVAAIADGVVVDATTASTSELGVHVIIRHRIHGEVVESVYGHLLEGTMPLKAGDTVQRGQIVGLVGSTGESTGPHLHFGILRDGVAIDPVPWLQAHVAG